MNNPAPFINAAKSIKDCYITHAAVRAALTDLEETHIIRGHAILIGEPGLGKTATLNKYRNRSDSNTAGTDPTADELPILLVSMPAVLNVKNFVEQLLRELDSPIMKLKKRPGIQDLMASLVTLMEHRKVTMLMIDEFQNLLSNSRVRSSQAILETIKQLMSATEASIVLTGTPQGWKDLQQHDDGSVAQRLAHHINLAPFSMTTPEATKRFKSYLKTMVAWFNNQGIDANCLLVDDMPERLFKCTGGIPRDIASLLRLALTSASRTSSDSCLEVQHFFNAFPKFSSEAAAKLRTNPFNVKGR